MVYDLKFTLIWERASIHVGCKWRRYKSNRKFLPRWFRYGLSLSFSWFTSQYSEGINFDWLNGCICWTLASKTFAWTRITQDLRNGGPLEMLSIAKPIEIKVLLHQFSLLMFNLHYIFLFTVFLPDRSISVLPLFLGKCRTVISSRGPKSAKKENKKILRRFGSFLSGMLFTLYESFASQTFASLGFFTWLIYVCTYCVPIATVIQNKRSWSLFLGEAQIKRNVSKH